MRKKQRENGGKKNLDVLQILVLVKKIEYEY
jgi:hypothetical protein